MVNKEKLLANAQKFISKGQISKAVSEYETLVGAFPKDVRNRQKLAELLSRDKREEEALKEYEAVASHYTETGFYLKAIAVFKQMQKIEPSRLDIYHRLAELNEKQGLIGNALTEYRNLVAYYENHQRYQEAVEVLEKMLDLDPGNLTIAAKIAECCMALDQKDQAYEKFQEVVAALAAHGNHAKVIKLYDHFIEICPEDGTARLPLARSLLGSGSSAKALQVLKDLVKHSPEDAEINRCLADAYVAVEDYANARLTLNHLLKLHEDDLDLREYYVRTCLDAGEAARARDRLDEWQDSFFHNGRLTALKGFLEELEGLLPGDPLVAATLSAVHEALAEQDRLEPADAPGQISLEAPETAASAVLKMAIDDVETIDAGQAVDEPPVEEIELDLDLGDLVIPSLKDEAAAAPAELESGQTEDAELAPPADADEEMEVELEVDLDDLDDFELDFDDDSVPMETASAEEPPPADFEEETEWGTEEGEAATTEGQGVDLELPAADEAELAESDDLAIRDADSLDGFVSEEQLKADSADQVEAWVSEEDRAEKAQSETILANSEPDLVAAELDPAYEELDLAGEELDLTSAELGYTGAEPGSDAEEFFSLDEESAASTDEAGSQPAVDDDESGEPLAELLDMEDFEELKDVVAAPDEGAVKVEAELEEVQFYLQQGLYDNAERLVQALIESRPEMPELQAELADIERARQAAGADVEGEAFVDLMAGLQDEDLLDATGFLDSFADSGHVDDDLSQKLVSELDSADTESHYNLGIAYKEMGLYNEAIAEFDKAANDPARNLDCITLTGQCHMEAGDRDSALAVFKSGLANPELNEVGRMTLNFELGMLHRLKGELLEALEYFQLVAEKDTFFRDVSELIRALRKELGLDDSDDDGPQGNRDRVSYV